MGPRTPAAVALSAAALITILMPQAASAAPSAHPSWVIEASQYRALSATAQAELGNPAQLTGRPPFTTGAEHYTAAGVCPHGLIVTRCLSLTASPPPAGTLAVYDDERWIVTPLAEWQHPCFALAKAGRIIRAADALPVLSPPRTVAWQVRCAAVAAGPDGVVHLQIQDEEAHLATFTALITTLTAAATRAQPGVTVSFGLSTNPKYGATAATLCAAYKAGLAADAGAPVWLNVLPWPGGTPTPAAVAMATAFLACASGSGTPAVGG